VDVVQVGERKWSYKDDDEVRVSPLYRIIEVDEPLPPGALPATFDLAPYHPADDPVADGCFNSRSRLDVSPAYRRAELEARYAGQDREALRQRRLKIIADRGAS
jgi:hypothetical protein